MLSASLLFAAFPFAMMRDCSPCGSPEAVDSVRRHLEEAFRAAMALSDCRGPSNLQACRTTESLLSDAFEALEKIFEAGREAASPDCLSCDPGPRLTPLAASLVALGRLLEERGHEDFAPALRRMEVEVERWKGSRCCDPSAPASSSSDREEDARAVLTEKCGSDFASFRRGLRQVVRAPGEREGCYQSRACREPGASQGQRVEGGFWTYDGEYWYVWSERRTPRGEWVSCDP